MNRWVARAPELMETSAIPTAATISATPISMVAWSRIRALRADRKSGGHGLLGPARPVGAGQDNGSATVTACLALMALIVLTALVTQLVGLVVARHRAQAVADLAALAAAGELRHGAESGCAVAETLGRRMQVGILRCEVSGWDVLIEAEGKIPIGPFGSRSVRAIARAGPAEERP